MNALIFDGELRLERTANVPVPSDTECLVRVRLAGICSTDLEITKGYRGFRGILGHEFVGEVVTSPDRTWLGQRVCPEITIWCGSCSECVSGRTGHCLRRKVLGIDGHDGGFAEYVTVPVANLHAVPEALSDEVAVFTEPLAAAFEILEQIDIGATDRVVVLGDGRLGLLCAQVLATTGAQVTVVGRHRDKLSLLKETGIRTSLDIDDLVERPDVVVEATGAATGLGTALDVVRPRGTVVLKSTVAGPTALDISVVAVRELTILGSRCGPFPRALAGLESGQIDVRPMISAVMPLTDGVAAFGLAAERGTLKVLIDPSA